MHFTRNLSSLYIYAISFKREKERERERRQRRGRGRKSTNDEIVEIAVIGTIVQNSIPSF